MDINETTVRKMSNALIVSEYQKLIKENEKLRKLLLDIKVAELSHKDNNEELQVRKRSGVLLGNNRSSSSSSGE